MKARNSDKKELGLVGSQSGKRDTHIKKPEYPRHAAKRGEGDSSSDLSGVLGRTSDRIFCKELT